MPDKSYTPAEVAISKQLVAHIPAWLKFRQLTQEQAANKLGVSTGTMSKWLSGKIPVPGPQLWAIAQLLKLDHISQLFFAPDHPVALDGYENAAEIIDGLTPEDRARWLTFGRNLLDSSRKSE